MWFIGLTVITLSVVLNIAVFVSVKGILGEVYLLHTGFAGSVQCLYKVSGCAGGMVAGVWRLVVVSVGRGENLIYFWSDRRRRNSFPSSRRRHGSRVRR